MTFDLHHGGHQAAKFIFCNTTEQNSKNLIFHDFTQNKAKIDNFFKNSKKQRI